MQRYVLRPALSGIEALAPLEIPSPESFRVLAITDRSAVVALLSALPFKGAVLSVDHLEARPVEVASSPALVARATVAIVDPVSDTARAVEICRELRRLRARLPIALVICCAGSLSTWEFRRLMASGARGIFSLHETAEGVSRALQRLARGDAVVRLEAPPDSPSLLPFLVSAQGSGQPEAAGLRGLDAEVLAKLAHGLSDREIGADLHLSPFTVKHHIERMRDTLGARNRIELAAWAGRHGFH